MTQTKQAMQLLTLRIICGFYSFLPHCYTQHLLHAKVKNLYSNRYVRSKLIPIILLFYPGHAMGLRIFWQMEKVLKETNASVVGEPYELVWGWKPEHFTRTPQEKWLS